MKVVRQAISAEAIAEMLPELIEPDTWQPRGQGAIGAIGDSIVVRHNGDVRQRIATLLEELLPGRVVHRPPAAPPPPLAVPGPRPNWPQSAEPRDKVHEAIERTLAVPAEIDVSAIPLAEVLKQLGERYGVPVEIDGPALEGEGVVLDTLVTRRIRNVPLRSLLRLLLADYRLDYVIRDEVLIVTTPVCEPLATIKIYPVFDLVCRAGGKADEGAGLDYQAVIEGLTACVAPTTWDAVGGAGDIKVFEPAGALVISQTAAVQEEIARYFKSLRDLVAR